MSETKPYTGFEQGPIRPPSEANSLLLRITRNCPWNRCKFCGLYRGQHFSVRPVEHLIRDIDAIKNYVAQIQELLHCPADPYPQLKALDQRLSPLERPAFHAALRWLQGGMKSVFLQDANSLVIKAPDLIAILEHLHSSFPQIERVTSYARSHSVARIADGDLKRMARAGLNRIHIGLESAADTVLDFVDKGVDKQTHIIAGQRVKRAGIELSEYFMPGLGGVEYSRAHVLETADALNQIDPDFIRIRTLVIPAAGDLYREVQGGTFTPLGDIAKAEELLLLLDNLAGIGSIIKSDHSVNLFQEVEGQLPQDRERMTAPIRDFLVLEQEEQLLYLVGRRCGILSRLIDLNDASLRRQAQQALTRQRVSWENVDDWAAKMLQRNI
jgi:hypothetical protein